MLSTIEFEIYFCCYIFVQFIYHWEHYWWEWQTYLSRLWPPDLFDEAFFFWFFFLIRMFFISIFGFGANDSASQFSAGDRRKLTLPSPPIDITWYLYSFVENHSTCSLQLERIDLCVGLVLFSLSRDQRKQWKIMEILFYSGILIETRIVRIARMLRAADSTRRESNDVYYILAWPTKSTSICTYSKNANNSGLQFASWILGGKLFGVISCESLHIYTEKQHICELAWICLSVMCVRWCFAFSFSRICAEH